MIIKENHHKLLLNQHLMLLVKMKRDTGKSMKIAFYELCYGMLKGISWAESDVKSEKI